MTDHLASLSPDKVAAWYRRLADRIATEKVNGEEPLASQFLRFWLDNRSPDAVISFKAPSHLRGSSYVTNQLNYHRGVFLTEQRARVTGGGEKWAGVLPRIQGKPGFTRWDVSRPLELTYESLVEVGNGLVDLVRIQRTGTPEERDLLTSLRGFQLKSRVTVSGARQANGKVRITFTAWYAQARDRYDWNYSEHFTVPNPDYRSTKPDAVRPKDEMLTVYHRNAERLEKAGLAAPYDVLSNEWSVTSANLLRGADVDPQRRL